MNKRYSSPTLPGVQEARDPAAEEPRGCAGVQEEEEGVHQVSGEQVQCSTVQYSAVQCSTVQCSAVLYSAVQYSTVQYSTVQYSTVPNVC